MLPRLSRTFDGCGLSSCCLQLPVLARAPRAVPCGQQFLAGLVMTYNAIQSLTCLVMACIGTGYVVITYVVMAYTVMAFVVMTCLVVAYVVLTYVAMACLVMANIVMAYTIMTCIGMAHLVAVYVVMAYVVMAYAVMTCLVMAYMAARPCACSPRTAILPTDLSFLVIAYVVACPCACSKGSSARRRRARAAIPSAVMGIGMRSRPHRARD